MKSRKLGVHLSIKGGMYHALETAKTLHINSLQLFLKNTNRWSGKEYSEDDISRFQAIRLSIPDLTIFAHSGYLINLSGNREIQNKSIHAVIDELNRTMKLDIPYLIIHPGSYKEYTLDYGINQVADSLDTVISVTKCDTMILLETTAGQGFSIGHRFEHLARIIKKSHYGSRLGICIDTCHIFAAGYNFTTAGGHADMIKEIQDTFGIEKIKCIHLNDSKRECGSRVDRHEHLGKGKIGPKGFINLLSDDNLYHIPLILETPKEMKTRRSDRDDLYADKQNLKYVRNILRLHSK